ncbi:YlxQ-related RNA-binding protein [Enterococcus sp. LJL98]
MSKEKALNLLGLAMRAGQLVTGEELTLKDIRANKVRLVFIAQDAGKNTQKSIKDKSSYYKVPCFDCFDSTQLSLAIGKNRMVVGVKDQGFAKKIEELLLS